MRLFPVALLISPLVVLCTPSAQAESFPRPKVDFSAEGTLHTGQLSIDSKLFYSQGKERREHHVQGRSQVIIVRHDKKRVWVLLPEPKMYVELATEQSRGTVGDLPEGAKLEKSRLGEENINGQSTTKYRIEVNQEDGSKLEGLMWVTADDIVMKMDANAQTQGAKTAFNLELRNIRRGRQDPTLFELPEGYQQVPADAPRPHAAPREAPGYTG